MPELRWTLLVLGVLFIIALAWWELRRPRQARRNDLERRSSHPEPDLDTPRIYKEPTLGLPEIRAMPEVRSREPVQDLPVVQIREDGPIGLRVEARNSKPVTVDRAPVDDEPPADEPSEIAFEEEVSAARIVDPKPAVASVLASNPPALPEPIVDWPPDDKRKIVALRLVAPGGDRFAGHAVRQALAAEGFLLGKFDIFHKPGPDSRAVLSAASLTKPGTFDRESIDMQRFGGLNLFAVLPGPLPGVEAFDELIASARSLNARLEGALQDERGAPLTPTRITTIRDELAAAEPNTENVPES